MLKRGNSTAGSGKTRQRPNCFKCRHLLITWERGRGYACRAMGFKSQVVPWRVVVKESGMPCLMFEPKPANTTK